MRSDRWVKVNVESRTGREQGSVIEPAWTSLWHASAEANPFQHPTWCQTWIACQKRTGLPTYLLAWQKERLIGCWPIWQDVSRSIAVGHGLSDWCSPLVDSKAIRAINFAEATSNLMDSIAVCDWGPLPFCISLIMKRSPRHFLVGNSWSVQLPESWPEQLLLLSDSLRKDLDRLERCEVTVSNASTSVRDLEDLFTLHRLRSRSARRWSSFLTSGSMKFHRMLCANPLSEDIVRIVRVFSDGNLIASAYGLKSPAGMFFYQSGMNPAQKSLSPGSLAIAGLMRQAIEEGCPRFYFLRGLEPYKLRWKPTTLHFHWRNMCGEPDAMGMVSLNLWSLHALAEKAYRNHVDAVGLEKFRIQNLGTEEQ